jgi:CelD/BcsL family acetyltransferase involved in cellulose biosynthesis
MATVRRSLASPVRVRGDVRDRRKGVTVHTSFAFIDRIESVAEEWDELARSIGAAPFLRPGWVAAWWEAFGRGRLEIATLRRGALVAVLPLSRRHGLRASTTNWHTPVYGPVCIDADAARQLAERVFSQGLQRIELSFVDRADPALPELRRAAAASGYQTVERTRMRSPYLPIEGDWASFLARLTSKRRNRLRRLVRGLETHGTVHFEVLDGSERLDELLEEVFAVEASSWKGAARSAIVSRRDTHHFYARVARWAAEQGILRLGFLRVDGKPVAVHYCLEADGVHYIIKPGYDPAYRKEGPGIVIEQRMLERAHRVGVRQYEFLGGDEEHKLSWTSTVHERQLLQAFRRSPAGLVDWAAHRYGRSAARRALASLGR